MQAVAWDWAPDRNRAGMAMAASKAMIATTIIISTNVNPRKPVVRVVFIFHKGGVNLQRAG